MGRRLDFAQPANPFLALALVDVPGGRAGRGREHGTGVSDDAEVDVPIASDSPVVKVDLHDRRFGGQPFAVSHPEVERRADDDDQVRVAEGMPAGELEVQRVVGR